MKKIIAFIAVALMVLTLAAGIGVAQAANNKSSTLGANETYNGLYIRAGNTVNVSGNVNGDVFLAGQEITIDGEVSGNVYAAGQNVTIKGKVGGGVHLAGARVEVSGEVGDSVLAVGSIVNLTKDAKVGGGVMTAGSTIDIAAPIKSDVYAAGSTVTIGGRVGGSINVSAEQLTLARGASVGGSLTYASAQDATIENDTKINGSIKRVDPKTVSQPSAAKRAQDTIYAIIAQLLIGLIIIRLLPQTAIATTDYINKNPFKSFLGGIGVVFGALLAFVVALIAVFGWPLALMIALSFVLLVMTAVMFVTPFWIGRLVIRTRDNNYGNLALSLLGGVVIVALVMLLPVAGALFGLVMFFISVGALSLRSYDRFKSISKAQQQNT